MERRVETKPQIDFALAPDYQESHIPLDVLWSALGVTPDRDKKWRPQIQMNMSDIGEWYPTILQILDLEEESEKPEKVTDPADTNSTISEVLRKEDRLYDFIRQSADGKDIFPTDRQSQRTEFIDAKEGLSVFSADNFGESAAYEITAHQFDIARSRISDSFNFSNSNAIPLPLFGIPDPRAQRDLVDGAHFQGISNDLLSVWAHTIITEHSAPYFNQAFRSQRGVGVIFNSYQIGIQMRLSLEQIIYDRKNLDKGVWMGEFIVGHPNLDEDEVQHRKAQVKMLVGSAFVNNFIAGKQRIKDGAYATISRHDQILTPDKVPVNFFDRYFDPDSGQMFVIPRQFSKFDRQEFVEWYYWFGYASNTLKTEVERRLKKRTSAV